MLKIAVAPAVSVAGIVDCASAAEGSWARNSAIWRSVRSEPRCSGLTVGASGKRSCMAERISTRLIESMPRSASSCMSSSSMSTG